MTAAERSRAEAPERMCMDAPGIASMVLDSSARCGQTVRVDTFTVSFEAGHVAQDCGSSGAPGSSSRFARRRADERVTDRGCGRAMVAARQTPKKTVHAYGGAPSWRRDRAPLPWTRLERRGEFARHGRDAPPPPARSRERREKVARRAVGSGNGRRSLALVYCLCAPKAPMKLMRPSAELAPKVPATEPG